MTSSHELEVRHYWRTSQALNKQRREGAPVSEMADNLDEIDTLAQVTSHPHIRALCLAALTVIGGASASTAATLPQSYHGYTALGHCMRAAMRIAGFA